MRHCIRQVTVCQNHGMILADRSEKTTVLLLSEYKLQENWILFNLRCYKSTVYHKMLNNYLLTD